MKTTKQIIVIGATVVLLGSNLFAEICVLKKERITQNNGYNSTFTTYCKDKYQYTTYNRGGFVQDFIGPGGAMTPIECKCKPIPKKKGWFD